MAVINGCEAGYCSKAFNEKDVEDCQASLAPDWNGLCGFQDGNPITGKSEELTCCAMGCTMNSEKAARWNGLCAYQGKSAVEFE